MSFGLIQIAVFKLVSALFSYRREGTRDEHLQGNCNSPFCRGAPFTLTSYAPLLSSGLLSARSLPAWPAARVSSRSPSRLRRRPRPLRPAHLHQQGAAIEFAELERPIDARSLSTKTIRQHALTNRTDILRALADYAASQSALQLEVARQYPDVRLGPGYTFEVGEHRWSLIGAALTLPIFNQNQGPIAEAEARRREAAASPPAAGCLSDRWSVL